MVKTLEIVKREFGEPSRKYALSVADENDFANELHVPVVTIGPLGGGHHSQDEWVSRQSLRDLVRLYRTLVEEL